MVILLSILWLLVVVAVVEILLVEVVLVDIGQMLPGLLEITQHQQHSQYQYLHIQ
jgi:hypothetical protein